MRPTRHTPAPAFTLVEVMLAVVILGLGLLGLSALFAGAASTQQRGAEVNLSVGVTRNAEAVLSRNFGQLAGPDLARVAEQEGQWLKTLSSGERGGWALTSNLSPLRGVTRQDENYGVYFRRQAEQFVIYEGPDSVATAIAVTNTGPPQFVSSDGSVGANFLVPNQIKPLPDSRVDPLGTLNVRVEFGSDDGSGGVAIRTQEFRQVDSEVVTAENDDSQAPAVFQLVLQPTDDSDVLPGDDPVPGGANQIGPGFNLDFSTYLSAAQQNLSTPGSQHPADFDEFVHIDLAAAPSSPRDRAAVKFFVRLQTGEWIRRVVIAPYSWRDDRLISLNDRFTFTPDPLVPGGRRPILGYTALVRSLGTGGSQMVIFTYSLLPLGPVRSNTENIAFIPPETERVRENSPDSDKGLMRLVDMPLGYEPLTQRFYVVADASSEAEKAAVDPGQILLMKESENLDPDQNSQGMESRAGSDVAVRVVSQEQDPANPANLRGYLDGSPRVKGRSPVRNLETGAPVLVKFWCFNPVVESLTSDRTEWRVRPVEARVFQVGVSY
jgi:prepilin-type N-terminal cleavage/methylation domain-containing protein